MTWNDVQSERKKATEGKKRREKKKKERKKRRKNTTKTGFQTSIFEKKHQVAAFF